jgi:diguanylate cyclase (GGDEF)-like protein
MRSHDGDNRCLAINAVPMLDNAGQWFGARGVCRDITVAHEQRMALTRLTERERIIDSVIEAMRSAPEPSSMLSLAVRETAAAVDREVWLLRRNNVGLWYAADGVVDASSRQTAEEIGRVLESADPEKVMDYQKGIDRYKCRATRFGDVVNGAIIFVQRDNPGSFPGVASALMDALAGPIGIAIAQADQIERLQQLSSMDELTGLLNRRAFADAARRRMAMGRRQVRQAVFLYLDLDHFKPINDILGHQAGDALLRRLGQLLMGSTRANDLAVRLGGDEFGIWLDASDQAGAIAKAEALMKAVAELAPKLPAGAPSLGVSIGIAEVGAGEESVEDMLARADLALYDAKRSGRGTWRIARAHSKGV